MDSRRTREIVERWFEDLRRGDIEPVLRRLAPNVVHELPHHERNAVIEHLGIFVGREAVRTSFGMRATTTETVEYEVREIVTQEEKAFVVVHCVLRSTETGTTWSSEASHRVVLDDDGLIAFWTVYFDPSNDVVALSATLGERLIAAVEAGDEVAARTLLDHGADPGARSGRTGLTALMTAAGRGAGTIVRQLLDRGADVHTLDDRAGGTALHKAVQGGDVAIVRMLVEAGSFVDAATPTTGHTPLLDAFRYERPQIVGYLLERDAGIDVPTRYGWSLRQHVERTPSDAAGSDAAGSDAGSDAVREAERLLQRRAARERAEIDGHTLVAATLDGDIEGVRAQLAAGAEVDRRYPVVSGPHAGHTALLVAARDGRGEILRLLMDAGADVNAVEPAFGAGPLHKAVGNGHADITASLVGAPGIDIDVQGATDGYSPLHDALRTGDEGCARALLRAGARTDLVGHDGRTPMDVAAGVLGPDHPLTAAIRDASRTGLSVAA